MNETTPEKYKVWLSPEKEVELLTQLCAALLRKTRSCGGEDPNLVIVGEARDLFDKICQSVSLRDSAIDIKDADPEVQKMSQILASTDAARKKKSSC